MKIWYARLRYEGAKDYGRWVPTGEIDLDEAKWYMRLVYPNIPIKEWLLL